MTDEKRPYRKQRRAELEAETRRRITESAIELHGTLGPSRTSMSAIAAHAGVRRSTLYRHFSDEGAVFEACSAHWRASNPAPDLARWAAVEDPYERLGVALAEIYGHYRRTRRMMENLLRDEATVPAVGRTFRAYRDYVDAALDVLMVGTGLRGKARRRVRAAVGHGLAFTTWRSLAYEQELGDAASADLICRLVAAARD